MLFAHLHRNACFQRICTHNSVMHLSLMIPHQLASNWDWDRRWISTNSLGVTLVLKKINLSKKSATKTGWGDMKPSASIHCMLSSGNMQSPSGIMISYCSVASLEVLVELACRELQDLRKVQHVRNMQFHWLYHSGAIDNCYCMYVILWCIFLHVECEDDVMSWIHKSV